jgi:hypothetical protein
MADNFPHAKQRAALKKLALVINSSPKALRDDECGDPRINGSSGHIYATPRGFQLCVMTETARGWTAAKKALAFTQLANAGTPRASYSFHRLASPPPRPRPSAPISASPRSGR